MTIRHARKPTDELVTVALVRTLLLVAVLIAVAPPAVRAQDRPPLANVAGDGDDDAIGGDEMRRSASLFIVHKMRVALELSDKQVLDLLPKFERIEQLRAQSLERRRAIGEQLRTLANDKAADAKQVDALIVSLDREDEQVRVEQNRERDAILQTLDPHQRAGFVLLTQRLRHHMERGMERGRGPDGELEPGDGPPGERPADFDRPLKRRSRRPGIRD